MFFGENIILKLLLGINNKTSLLTHPKLGASWEGFALEEIIRFHKVYFFDCYFWAIYEHAELDLFIFKGGKRLGFEFKYTDSPKSSRSMSIN